MADSIKIGNLDISAFKVGSSDCKIYLGNVKLYPTVDPPTPTGQTPCFAVVDDISQYQDRTYVDAYDKASSKWYKLNNLNQYEQYGIYETGSSLSDFTYYDGKLVATGTTEYQYSGSSWVNVGTYEDSSTTLEINEETTGDYFGTILLTTFKIPYADVESMGSVSFRIYDTNDGSLSINLEIDWDEYEYIYYGDEFEEEGTVTNDGEYFYLSLPTITEITIESIRYWHSETIYIIYGSKTISVEYEEKDAPADNIVFSTMADALDYKCPWVGMTAKIASVFYIFSSSNEWLTKYNLVEVSGDYICYQGDKYIKMEQKIRNIDGTWSSQSPIVYRKGDLIEASSSDCPICTTNFCGVDANGNPITINNGSTTLNSNNFSSPYPVEGEVGQATTIIGQYCFQNIKNTITALTIGNSVTTIQHEAFMETENLTTLTIPSSVTQIDFWAFTRCYGMEEVIFEGTTPPNFTNTHSGVFHDYCPPVIYVPDSAVSSYRAISGSVWTNQSWSSDIIQPISLRP